MVFPNATKADRKAVDDALKANIVLGDHPAKTKPTNALDKTT